jgi:hypothetical protein
MKVSNESLDVAIGCEGRTMAIESCSIDQVGATIQAMVNRVVAADGAFDDISVSWTIDEDVLEEA